MADVVFVVNVKGWSKAFKQEKGMVGNFISGLTGDVEATTKFEAPGPGKFPRNRTAINYGKGHLMGSVDSKVYGLGVDEVEGHVIVKPAYARFVIHGTKGPYVIKPKKPGGFLRFYWFKRAKWMVVKSVTHPGIAANDFMIRALKRGFRANGLT